MGGDLFFDGIEINCPTHAPSTITVLIREETISGPVLGTTSLVLECPSPREWVHFDFPSPIALTCGEVFVLRVASADRSHRIWGNFNGGYTDVATSNPVTVETASNEGPTAILSATPTSGLAPLTVTFDATGSTDPDGNPLEYAFDFGDGTLVGPQAGATATHTYATDGVYTAMLSVWDGDLQDVTQVSILVLPVTPDNQLPVAQLVVTPASGPAPLVVTFDATGSTDPDGSSLTARTLQIGDQGSDCVQGCRIVAPWSADTPTGTFAAVRAECDPFYLGSTEVDSDAHGVTGND